MQEAQAHFEVRNLTLPAQDVALPLLLVTALPGVLPRGVMS
jgi:hypothetical protein